MKINAIVEPMKNLRGHIRGYIAKIGHWYAEGNTKAEAQDALAKLIERMATENAEPEVRIDPQDGHVWLAYRVGCGDWTYAHYRKPTAPYSGPIGGTRGSGWTMANWGRAEVVDAMDRHLVSLLPSPADVASAG